MLLQSWIEEITFVLVGVVIVFTVCQIPQATSLTLQSFFPVVAQTSKILIYNNFANCLVAINASMNFLLYCCFSGRFRSTCRSSFTVIYNHCANFIDPNWKLTKDNTKYSISFDNVSSTYSLHGQQLSAGLSNQSSDLNNRFAKYSAKSRTPMPNYSRPSWTILLSKFKSHQQNRNQLAQMLSTQSTETVSLLKV